MTNYQRGFAHGHFLLPKYSANRKARYIIRKMY